MTKTSDFWSKLPVVKKILTSGLITEFVSVDRYGGAQTVHFALHSVELKNGKVLSTLLNLACRCLKVWARAPSLEMPDDLILKV